MKTIIKQLCGKERVLKLGARQKKMYEDLTGKSFFSEEPPTYSDQLAMLRSAISFSDRKITEDQVFDIVEEIGDVAFFKIIEELFDAITEELEATKNPIPNKA